MSGYVSVVVLNYLVVYLLFTLCEVFSVYCMCVVCVVGSFIVCVVTLALKSSFNTHPR